MSLEKEETLFTKLSRAVAAIALVGGTAVATAVVTSTSAVGAPAWAPAATAAVHPGVQTFTNGAQCTANFVFYDSSNVYIGQAAHCAGTGGNTATNGCTSGSLPIGTPVDVTGASKPGTLVYSSWLTMQAQGETDANTCEYNDLALVKLDPSDVGNVNPTIPHWGGPDGIATGGTAAGDLVYSYGNSELRLGVSQLSPKTGVSLGDEGNGWSHDVLTVSPGIPGDSGSAFLDANGDALGILSTLQLAPLAGSNGVGDLNLELQYLHGHTSFTAVQLALGTQAFDGSQLPLG
ncbi:MAG TPA: serine protease [Acidimicrobiia bacterium]|nr:serine protease [Acidimicrobiia bacterium]